MIHEVKVYGPSGKLQKVISRKALNKRSDKLCQDPFLYSKPAKGKKKKTSVAAQEPFPI